VAHWKLDEGEGAAAADSGPQGLHLALANCEWVAGERGQALRFNRQGSFASCRATRASGVALANGGWTLSVRIKPAPDCTRVDLYEILNCHCSEWGPGWRLFYYVGGIWFRSGPGSKEEVTQLKTNGLEFPVAKGEWSAVHVVVDAGGGGRLYVNGELAVENAELEVHPPKSASPRLVLGCFTDTSKADRMGFKGCLDEVKIVNGAMSALEVLKDAKRIDF